jgi:hypothetical protein
MNILILAFNFLLLLTPAQKVVDQILTLVNGELITRTDLIWSLAIDPRAPNPAGGVSRDILQQKLDVMIDERLIRQEAARIPSAEITQAEIDKKRAELIKVFPSEAAFRERVDAVGLTAEKLDELLRQRVVIDKYVDFRFRSFVFVTDDEVKQYYNEKLSAQVKAQGAVPVPFDKVGDDIKNSIRELLKGDKVDAEINTWLTAARQRAEIAQLAEP